MVRTGMVAYDIPKKKAPVLVTPRPEIQGCVAH